VTGTTCVPPLLTIPFCNPTGNVLRIEIDAAIAEGLLPAAPAGDITDPTSRTLRHFDLQSTPAIDC
jgi:hypothetical protein